MLYLIGIGLNYNDLSIKALNIIKKCKYIYVESYTTDFPYSFRKLEKIIGKKIIVLKREDVENNFFEKILNNKNKDIALLIYGDPLIATTHHSLILEAEKRGVGVEIIHAPSIYTAISETGLQLYKFGKTTSLPKWKNNYKPKSFLKVIEDNKKMNAHTLILCDIDMEFKDALNQLFSLLNKNEKILVCSKIGTRKSKIYFGEFEKLKNKKVEKPFCFIIPSSLHFIEREFLKRFEQ